MEIGLKWYALYVRSRQEHMVADGLKVRGYEEFLPMYRDRRPWSDRQKSVELPLFPGYVFFRMTPAARAPLYTIPGLVSVVGRGHEPEAVEDSEIAQIQAISRTGMPAKPWPYLGAGRRVRIQHGALKDIEGIVTDLKGSLRLVLSVTLLQRSVAVEIDREMISPI